MELLASMMIEVILGEIIGMEHGPNSIGEPEEIETRGEMVSPWFQLQQTDADNNKNQIIESVKQVADATGVLCVRKRMTALRKVKEEG
jgi:hypothetical protein